MEDSNPGTDIGWRGCPGPCLRNVAPTVLHPVQNWPGSSPMQPGLTLRRSGSARSSGCQMLGPEHRVIGAVMIRVSVPSVVQQTPSLVELSVHLSAFICIGGGSARRWIAVWLPLLGVPAKCISGFQGPLRAFTAKPLPMQPAGSHPGNAKMRSGTSGYICKP